MRRFTAALACAGLAMTVVSGAMPGPRPDASKGITAVPGIKVGHMTLTERPTGCTVILVESGAVGGVDVRGGSPGTRETDLLDPVNRVDVVHAVVLSGGSAFGLDTASGVMRYLEEKNIGFETAAGPVPIVPAAILYDLTYGGNAKVRPDANCGYQAARSATDGPVPQGSVGAGAGATIGKFGGRGRAMKGGLGSSAIVLPDGLVVGAIVAVNAAGDVIDPSTGQVIAGVRTADGKGLADARKLLRAGSAPPPRPGENTTIGVVATNARLTKAQAQKVAQMAHDGYARAIAPSHTPGDGDTIFSLATGTFEGDVSLSVVGALAAEAISEAIVRAVVEASGSASVPAARELGTVPEGR
ncbi:MAG TPA: P1 family peptidase [Vicinamibacterales bacterium]